VDRPDLLEQWHDRKNKNIDPHSIPASYQFKVYWQCPVEKSHIWQAAVTRRVHLNTGCPKCSSWTGPSDGRSPPIYVLTPEKSLASLYPEVAALWHPTKNGDVTPNDVASGARKRAFFQCKRFADHVWETRVNRRPTDCPKCKSYRYDKKSSLKAKYPKIARQWHPTRNAPITPDCVSPKSNKKYWWVCPDDPDHEWETTAYNRTGAGTRCPVCSNRAVGNDNSLAALYPEISSQWHKEKNGALTACDVLPNSGKKVWWQCNQGPDHEWESTLHNRTRNNSGCPCCVGRKFSVTQTLAHLHPTIAKQWHPLKNGKVKPDEVKLSDERSFWWTCLTHSDHEWQSKINYRIKAQNACALCFKNKIEPGNTLHDVYPAIAREWHDKRNGQLTPVLVAAHSGKRVFWRCSKNARHIWQAQIGSRTGKDKTGCPRCHNQSKG